jgi:hypothetical protein
MVVGVGEVLPDLVLETANGQEVPISRFLDRPMIVQCLRYYG